MYSAMSNQRSNQVGPAYGGEDIMPPQDQLSDADALTLAKYILSLK